MEKLVVLSGAGVSAESGINTFRDENGLWEGHDVREVASPQGFRENPELVLDFYNKRRRQLKKVQPNTAHQALKLLEEDYEVQIITQNVDDLHERAGSTNVLHLHGELKKVKPIDKEQPVIHWEDDLNWGDQDERGVQLRPHVVWFGEAVPNIEKAVKITSQADLLLIIGTSMQVYPAAGLLDVAPAGIPIYIIDPSPINIQLTSYMHHIQKPATKGMQELVEQLI